MDTSAAPAPAPAPSPAPSLVPSSVASAPTSISSTVRPMQMSSNSMVMATSFGGGVSRLLQRPTQEERGRQTLADNAERLRENARNQRISTVRNGPMGTFSRDTAEEMAVPFAAAASAAAASTDTEQVAFGEQPGSGDLHSDAWKSTDEYRDL